MYEKANRWLQFCRAKDVGCVSASFLQSGDFGIRVKNRGRSAALETEAGSPG